MFDLREFLLLENCFQVQKEVVGVAKYQLFGC